MKRSADIVGHDIFCNGKNGYVSFKLALSGRLDNNVCACQQLMWLRLALQQAVSHQSPTPDSAGLPNAR